MYLNIYFSILHSKVSQSLNVEEYRCVGRDVERSTITIGDADKKKERKGHNEIVYVKFLWKESELNAKDNISKCCEILEKNKIKKG